LKYPNRTRFFNLSINELAQAISDLTPLSVRFRDKRAHLSVSQTQKVNRGKLDASVKKPPEKESRQIGSPEYLVEMY
jgi:hypothetical protein